MKLLIAAIAFQDPFTIKRQEGTVDYRKGAAYQEQAWRDLLEVAKQGERSKQDWQEYLEPGPLLGAMASMMSGDPMKSPEAEKPCWSKWTPDEVMLIYQDDTSDSGVPGPIKLRVEQTMVFFRNSGIKATPLNLELSVFDHSLCWSWMAGHLLPLLESDSEESLDVRILIGNATMALRLALFHLGVLTKNKGTQIWLNVDQKLAGQGLPAVRPLIHGESCLPELVPAALLEAKNLEIVELKNEIIRLKAGGSAEGEVFYSPEAKRVAAQAILDQLVGDPSAPIWDNLGGLMIGRLQIELADRMSQAGMPTDASSTKRWITDGSISERRAKKTMYLILDKSARRPGAS